jgi:hypothetical protein
VSKDFDFRRDLSRPPNAVDHIRREAYMSEQKFRSEEFQFNGDMLMTRIKDLIHQGNIRRIIIKNEEGKTLIDIPLTMGVVGALLAPQLAAIGAIAALVTHGTIVVEKTEA